MAFSTNSFGLWIRKHLPCGIQDKNVLLACFFGTGEHSVNQLWERMDNTSFWSPFLAVFCEEVSLLELLVSTVREAEL